MPRQIPRNGIWLSRAIRAVATIPSTPRSPKPPGTMIPSSWRRRSGSISLGTRSASSQTIDVEAPMANPAWRMASATVR